MWFSPLLLLSVSLAPAFGVAAVPSLSDVCTTTYVQSALPADGFIQGITPSSTSVTANPVTNYTLAAGSTNPSKTGLDFCNVTFSYTHAGRPVPVNLWFWLPSPSQFQNRFLATGGGGLAITSGQRGLGPGLAYGAAAATTDGGLGGWGSDLGRVLLRGGGALDHDALQAFGHRAIHEMSVLGGELTRKFYGSAPEQRIFSYFHGCSEGGREGWSQVQRYGGQFDGVAVGAPAFRQAFQQVLHLFSAVVENARGYYPPPCELERIANDTIAACDGLDGRMDGVVGRTDLCKLRYDAGQSVGKPYSCDASAGSGGGAPPTTTMERRQFGGGGPRPAAQGTVTAEAAAVAKDIWKGVFDSQGRQVYVSFQPSASFSDAATTFNATTGAYEATISGFGVQYVNLFLREVNSSSLSLANVTTDTLRGWMLEGMQKFSDTLQTTWPDLEDFHGAGGKVIHYHGESDDSVPAASSVMYHDAVRRTMYPGAPANESYAALDDWYRLFLVPGAGHCGPSALQPNGPFPQSVLQSLIDWVEEGINPTRLNATVLSGPSEGEEQKLCSFPLRPQWNEEVMDCVYDQESIDSWLPTLDSIPVPVY